MEKLYNAKAYGDNKEVASLVGIVENAVGYVREPINDSQYVLELKLDSFDAKVLVPMAHSLRIDKGEKVRVYSTFGFDRLRDGCGGLIDIAALEILDDNDKISYRFVADRDVRFKEE